MDQTHIPDFDGANNTAGNLFLFPHNKYRLDQAIQLDHLQNFSQGGRQDCPFGQSATPIRAQRWFLKGKEISIEILSFYSTCKTLATPSSTG